MDSRCYRWGRAVVEISLTPDPECEPALDFDLDRV